MQRRLRLQLFGQPKVYLGQTEIRFSFLKIEALLCYLAVMGEVNRDEIAGILWGEKENQVARKNLRNSIYQANKILGADFIISPSRNSLALNPAYEIMVDARSFEQSPLDTMALYRGEFLEGFYVKDDEAFDQWASRKRFGYQQLYVTTCYQLIEDKGLEDAEVEGYLRRLIDLDEFEEKHYRLLLHFYYQQGQFTKALDLYYGLVDLLDRELGVAPSEETESLYRTILSARGQTKLRADERPAVLPFWGRKHELAILEAYLADLEAREARGLYLLEGPFGVGKRRLLRQALLLRGTSLEVIKLALSPRERLVQSEGWRQFLAGLRRLLAKRGLGSSLSDESPGAALSCLLELAEDKPLVIVVENGHCLDPESLLAFEQVLHLLGRGAVSFFMTADGNRPLFFKAFLDRLDLDGGLHLLPVTPFGRKESQALLKKELFDRTLPEIERLASLCQGNPFFLSEYCHQLQQFGEVTGLPRGVEAYFSLLFEEVSSEAESLFYYLSCFRKFVPLSILAGLQGMEQGELTDLLECYSQQGILVVEEQGDRFWVRFSQKVAQLYWYQSLSPAKRRLYHQQIAKKLEETTSGVNDLLLYKEIAYQYKQAHNRLRSLAFDLKYLEGVLQYQHELFPIYYKGISEMESSEQEPPKDIVEELDRVRGELDEVADRYRKDRDFTLLRLRFLYLEGRYLIRIGDYQRGIHAIQQVIAFARELKMLDFLLEGYRQLIYYCIQTENISEMAYYTELALEDAVEANNHEAIALHLRLKGLYHLMIGDEEQATRHLYRSIDCFSLTRKLQEKYANQVAAALDYLAEIEQVRGHYQVALAHQQEAVKLVEHEPIESVRIVFDISLGITYYLMGELELAEQVLKQAQGVLSRLSFPWKEAQLELYLALIAYRKEDYASVQVFLAQKDAVMKRYANPRDKGMVHYLLALLAYQIHKGELSYLPLQRLVTEDFSYYVKVADQHLNHYRDRLFLQELEDMKADLVKEEGQSTR